MDLVQTIVIKKNEPCFTTVICGMIYLLKYHNNENHRFFVENVFLNMFENTNNYKLCNIENNKTYITLKNFYQKLNTAYPKKDTLEDYIFKITNNNNGFPNWPKRMFHFVDKEKIIYDFKNDLKNKLKLKSKINLDEEKLNSFDDKHYFLHIPSHTLKNEYDIKALDAFIREIYEKTPYQNLILLSGSNKHKKYCKDKFNIKTTHYYEELETKGVSHEKHDSFVSKTKGNLNSLMTDFLYIQESKAKYISLHHLTSINKNLLNNPIFLKQRIKEKIYVRNMPAAFDVAGMLVKENKPFEYET